MQILVLGQILAPALNCKMVKLLIRIRIQDLGVLHGQLLLMAQESPADAGCSGFGPGFSGLGLNAALARPTPVADQLLMVSLC